MQEFFMHEIGIFKDLIRKIAMISQQNAGKRILKMKIQLGALSHLSAPHFQHHFDEFSAGTAAENAEIEIIVDTDEHHPRAQDVVLLSVDIEE